METKVKKREWVKDAAIIFLAVLLVLTFFSNTIMNRSLPEVATAAVTEGSIVAKVRGSGTVTANGKQQVKAKETRTIRSVMIKAGQEVNAGDVLFVLGEGDETALEQAKETLRNLQYSYQRSAVSLPTFDGTSYQRAIDKANKAKQQAEAKRDQALADYNKAKGSLNDQTIDIDEYEKKLAYWETQLAAAEEALDIAKANLERVKDGHAEALAEVARCEALVESLKAQLAELDQESFGGVFEYHDEYGSEFTDEDYPGDDDVTVIEDSSNEDGAVTAEPVSDHAQGAGSIVFLTAFRMETPSEMALSLSNDLAANASREELQQQLDLAQQDLAKAKAELARIESEEGSSSEYAEAYAHALSVYNDCQSKYYQAITELKSEIPASVFKFKEAFDEAEAAYLEADQNLEYAREDLVNARESFNRTVASSYIDMQQTAEEIRLQQEKIKSLAGDEENVVTANVSGTVDTVDCTAGDTVLKDALLCTIEVPDMGHTLSFSVTNDQAQRLRIGDSATVSNYYWGNSVTATLTSIRTDPKNPQGSKVLTFDLTGDVTTGAEMTISVGQKSANYDLIVPNSAIKNDSNGSFVLAVSVKSSPLGNRYTARRVSVQVLASDDNNSAVVADLTNGDYVITTSSAPLKSGDMVRMADNS